MFRQRPSRYLKTLKVSGDKASLHFFSQRPSALFQSIDLGKAWPNL